MRYVKALSLCAAIVASVAPATISTPAFAKGAPILVQAPPEDLVSRHIGYADLNLATPAGAQALTTRVGGAVQGLCSEMTGADGSITSMTAIGRCSRASWQQARPQIDLAVQRAREIASTGKSSIVAAALTITAPTEK